MGVGDFWRWLWDTTAFKAPPACGGWSTALIVGTVTSNLIIAAVYYTIPLLILALSVRGDRCGVFPSRALANVFAAFILACGTTHLLRAATFLWPAYHAQALANGLTAAVSVLAVWMLAPLLLVRDVKQERDRVGVLTQTLERLASSLVEHEARGKGESLVADERMRFIERLMEELRGRGGDGDPVATDAS